MKTARFAGGLLIEAVPGKTGEEIADCTVFGNFSGNRASEPGN
jgi:hypothetical protein